MAKKTTKKPAKKKPAKKAAAKKAPAAKKASKKPATKAVKKPARKTAKKPVKKAVAKKPAKKAPAKKAARKTAKKPVKKAVAKKPAKKAPAKKPAVRRAASSSDLLNTDIETPKRVVKTPFKAKDLRKFRKMLLAFRDRLVDEVSFLAGDNLSRNKRETTGEISRYSYHMADQGTDNFDREFALNMVSSEQDIIYEVEEAIRRIDNKTYGICEISFNPIEVARLEAIPYARYSVKTQQELEKNGGRKRNFGVTLPTQA